MAHEELRAALETLHLPLHTGTVDDPHWSREIRTAQGSIAWCGASDGRAIAAAIVRAVNAAPELLRERDAHKQASELSAAALRGVSEELARVTADARALKETLHDEMAENLRLRELGGAKPDENITAMTERVIAERDALAAKVQEMTLQALTDSGQWIEHTGELAAKVKALEADAARLDFVEANGDKFPRYRKKRWAFIGLTSYEYETHATVREAIDAARGEQA